MMNTKWRIGMMFTITLLCNDFFCSVLYLTPRNYFRASKLETPKSHLFSAQLKLFIYYKGASNIQNGTTLQNLQFAHEQQAHPLVQAFVSEISEFLASNKHEVLNEEGLAHDLVEMIKT